MLSWVLHLKNKYPGGRVSDSDNAIDCYDASGEHVVALRKNGAGQWQDESEKYGLSDRFCLAPIPKDSRVHKLVDGKIALDDKAAHRMEKRKGLLRGNKILSEKEYEAEAAAQDKAE